MLQYSQDTLQQLQGELNTLQGLMNQATRDAAASSSEVTAQINDLKNRVDSARSAVDTLLQKVADGIDIGTQNLTLTTLADLTGQGNAGAGVDVSGEGQGSASIDTEIGPSATPAPTENPAESPTPGPAPTATPSVTPEPTAIPTPLPMSSLPNRLLYNRQKPLFRNPRRLPRRNRRFLPTPASRQTAARRPNAAKRPTDVRPTGPPDWRSVLTWPGRAAAVLRWTGGIGGWRRFAGRFRYSDGTQHRTQ